MNASRHRQRGAVTLVGALFVVVILSVLAVSLLRMAGSNILDSAVQNDAVEALFVAETGIEHASFLYADTGNCVALAGLGPINAGRGSFTLSNAVVQAGGECRITVIAGVSSAPNTAPAVRTIVADLRLNVGGDGWIVGDSGTILRWDGANWNAFASPTSNDLFDVHCVSAADCKAVGENGTIIHWDGANWSTVASGTGSDLYAISCEPNNPNNCFAAGETTFGFPPFFFFSQAIIQHWDGTSWSNSVSFGFSFGGGWRLNDLSCPSAGCYAIADNGFIARYDPGGGNWVDDNSNTSIPLNGVSCTADDYCWAVGDRTGNTWNFDFRDTGWTPLSQVVVNQARQNLNAVSCADSNNCWAVGDRRGNRSTLGLWNGTSWTPLIQNISGSQTGNLTAVHCLAGNDCWAVGDYRNGGNVIHYDGANWTYIGAAVVNNTDLNGVHFPAGAGGGGGGGITLIRWQEIISN